MIGSELVKRQTTLNRRLVHGRKDKRDEGMKEIQHEGSNSKWKEEER
jgi:hypothetical protein